MYQIKNHKYSQKNYLGGPQHCVKTLGALIQKWSYEAQAIKLHYWMVAILNILLGSSPKITNSDEVNQMNNPAKFCLYLT